jgi:hypothetical protein
MKFNIKESTKNAIQSALLVLKLIIPLFILAEILLYLDVLKYASFIFEPITNVLDLPKEASVGIATAMFFNIYAGLAFLAPLHLSPYEWTILGTFLGVAHSLVVENVIMKKIGIPYWYSWGLRIGLAFLAIVPLKFMSKEYFQTIHVNTETIVQKAYANFTDMILHALKDSVILSLKVIAIVTAIIFIMDYLKSREFMEKYQQKTDSLFSILAGLLLGITYGAGIILTEVKKGTLGKADIFYIGTFLMICHSIIEDILLFVIFGANGWMILAIRLTMAFVFSYILVILYKRKLNENSTVS